MYRTCLLIWAPYESLVAVTFVTQATNLKTAWAWCDAFWKLSGWEIVQARCRYIVWEFQQQNVIDSPYNFLHVVIARKSPLYVSTPYWPWFGVLKSEQEDISSFCLRACLDFRSEWIASGGGEPFTQKSASQRGSRQKESVHDCYLKKWSPLLLLLLLLGMLKQRHLLWQNGTRHGVPKCPWGRRQHVVANDTSLFSRQDNSL